MIQEKIQLSRRSILHMFGGLGASLLKVRTANAQEATMLKGEWYGEPWSFSTVFRIHFVFRSNGTYNYDVSVGDLAIASHSGRYSIVKDKIEAGSQSYKLSLTVTHVDTQPSPSDARLAAGRSILLNSDSTYILFFNKSNDLSVYRSTTRTILWGLKRQT